MHEVENDVRFQSLIECGVECMAYLWFAEMLGHLAHTDGEKEAKYDKINSFER